MTGRAEVRRLKQRLDATFKRLDGVEIDIELQSDFARYLCVLVSGYLENAVYELVVEHARKTGAPSLQRFVEQRTKSFTNAKAQKLTDLLGDFDPEWRSVLSQFLVGDLKDAVDGVVDLRNKIAHGESVGATYARVVDYYARVQKVVEFIADVCDPRA
jgi:RiboL-PSP-HEPN